MRSAASHKTNARKRKRCQKYHSPWKGEYRTLKWSNSQLMYLKYQAACKGEHRILNWSNSQKAHVFEISNKKRAKKCYPYHSASHDGKKGKKKKRGHDSNKKHKTDLSDEAHLRLADVVAGVHGGVGRGDDGHEVCFVPRVGHWIPHGMRRKPFRQMLLLRKKRGSRF